MAIGLLGKKLGMTQIFDEHGAVIPVTLIQAGPCPILQKRVPEKDGYSALQIAFDPRSEKNVTRPMMGHFKKAGTEPHRCIREVRLEDINGYEVGQTLDVALFAEGEMVDVSGVSKGRGFAGTIKRHHSHRGPTTHGSNYHRRVGSLSASSDPSRVYKGKIGCGHMGSVRCTVQNLKIVSTDPERNLLVVRGSVPGCNNGYVVISKSVKAAASKAR
jgi:large subunit ribosomal protein L3